MEHYASAAILKGEKGNYYFAFILHEWEYRQVWQRQKYVFFKLITAEERVVKNNLVTQYFKRCSKLPIA